MSIWCSWEDIGFDTWNPRRKAQGGQVRSYASGWSNHYPTTNGRVERKASIDLASIAPWCVPGYEESDGYANGEFACGPWLRLAVDSQEHVYHNPRQTTGPIRASVVLDEDAVKALHQQLTDWLARPKFRPAP